MVFGECSSGWLGWGRGVSRRFQVLIFIYFNISYIWKRCLVPSTSFLLDNGQWASIIRCLFWILWISMYIGVTIWELWSECLTTQYHYLETDWTELAPVQRRSEGWAFYTLYTYVKIWNITELHNEPPCAPAAHSLGTGGSADNNKWKYEA